MKDLDSIGSWRRFVIVRWRADALTVLAALVLCSTLAARAEAASCETLQSLALPETTILSAALVPAGPFTPPSGAGGRRTGAQAAVRSRCAAGSSAA